MSANSSDLGVPIPYSHICWLLLHLVMALCFTFNLAAYLIMRYLKRPMRSGFHSQPPAASTCQTCYIDWNNPNTRQVLVDVSIISVVT